MRKGLGGEMTWRTEGGEMLARPRVSAQGILCGAALLGSFGIGAVSLANTFPQLYCLSGMVFMGMGAVVFLMLALMVALDPR
jgi:hypothetical protein